MAVNNCMWMWIWRGCCALLLIALLASCSDVEDGISGSDTSLRPLLERTLQQALHDSAALAEGHFRASATMQLQLQQDDRQVRVLDHLTLARGEDSGYVAEQESHLVEGDSTLLKNMYAFEDSRGQPRDAEQARLASLNFGTSFPLLLRSLLAGGEDVGYEMRSRDTSIDGRSSVAIRYSTPVKSGTFWIDNGTMALVRLEVRQRSNYIVGSYDYHAGIDFRRSGGLLLPVRTETRFDYRRLFSDGTGIISVMLNNISHGSDTTGTGKQ